jgi:phosphoserine/homoserine phosphotransferase
MHIVCLDLEGVLVPEIRINVARKTGIEELKLTTRDISDYDELMRRRLKILEENNLLLNDIQEVIRSMDPLTGGKEFFETLRTKTQVIILSDTFTQFARPLMEKLGWPTIFCNTLNVDSRGAIVGYTLRQKDGKRKAAAALRDIGFSVLAAGDSYNDVTMLQEATEGVFFKPPDGIVKEYPNFPVTETYPELMNIIDEFISNHVS